MKARTLGPVLMMTLGAAIVLAPTSGWVGAGDPDPCLEDVSAAGATDPTCCENTQAIVVDPCVATTIAETTTTVAATTTTIAATTTTVAATTTSAAAVAVPSTTDIGSGAQGLPATGDTSSTYVVLGGLLLIGGAGLLVVGRGKSDAAVN